MPCGYLGAAFLRGQVLESGVAGSGFQFQAGFVAQSLQLDDLAVAGPQFFLGGGMIGEINWRRRSGNALAKSTTPAASTADWLCEDAGDHRSDQRLTCQPCPQILSTVVDGSR